MKLILHAGFAKAGSSSIQAALNVNVERLRKEQIHKFGEDLRPYSPSAPVMLLQELGRTRTPVTDRVLQELDRLGRGTAIISAENLQYPHMPTLFRGIDRRLETTVVFYLRPQHLWLPSAWKQWYMKDGTSLRAFVRRCLNEGTPANLKSLLAWKEQLPQARIEVRPFVEEGLLQGSVTKDFFRLIGSEIDPGDIRANEGIDYSIQHLMVKHAKGIFSHLNDVDLEYWLVKQLPAEYRRNNAPMLDAGTSNEVFQAFREDNILILSEYSAIENPGEFVDRYFRPREQGDAYLEMDDRTLLARAMAILEPTIGAEETKRRFCL